MASSEENPVRTAAPVAAPRVLSNFRRESIWWTVENVINEGGKIVHKIKKPPGTSGRLKMVLMQSLGYLLSGLMEVSS